jgi:hypothetical protein
MSFSGHISEGRVVFDQPVSLPEGTPVRIVLADAAQNPTLLERLGDVVGKAVGLPEDSSRNVDHYLYGQPKK